MYYGRMQTLIDLAEDLATGRTSARALTEQCLARIADPAGEGARVFTQVQPEAARACADAADLLRKAGRAPSPYAGIPISVKDLFDIAGEPTLAGSRAMAGAPPATEHAPVVARILAAGLVPIGRTNMTEFAFSGLGINPHYGTPANPWDRATPRIPGGSSSGAAVSVADGMAFGALGTDTGGSCRVPAALCGVTGYKPTARRVPIKGVLPLAPSLDSIGPLAPSVTCCAILDAILAEEPPQPPLALPLTGLRLAIPANIVREAMDTPTATAFEHAISGLTAAGARINVVAFPMLDAISPANRLGGFAAAEAYAWHRFLLARKAAEYDPRIRARIERGANQSAADYIELQAARARVIADMNRATAAYDGLLMPTVPIVAPPIAALDDEAEYNRVNMLLLRNPSLFNFLDRCAISLPCHRDGDPPAGLMLVGETMGDYRLFSIALAVEQVLRSRMPEPNR
jgi:aspartyl-tRNA(Asn)/glutamyl-tRNA(Gln) amidotransferase subunit A